MPNLEIRFQVNEADVQIWHYLRALVLLVAQPEAGIVGLRVAGRYFDLHDPAWKDWQSRFPPQVKVEPVEELRALGRRGYLLAQLAGSQQVLYGRHLGQVQVYTRGAVEPTFLDLVRRGALLLRVVECAEMVGVARQNVVVVAFEAGLDQGVMVTVTPTGEALLCGPASLTTTLRTIGGRAGAIVREKEL